MKELIEKVRNFREEREWDKYHSPKNLSMALMVEAAELMEHFQWLSQEESLSLPSDKLEEVREEIADVLIYLVNIADKLGIDPLHAALDKIEKNAGKYPVEVVRGRAKV